MRDQALSPIAGELAGPAAAPRGVRSLIGFARKRPSFLIGFAIVAVTMFLVLLRHQFNQRQFDSVALIGEVTH